MKKTVFLAILFVLVMSSIGMCAVQDPDSGLGDVQVGYNYYNLSKSPSGNSQGNTGLNEIYGSVGIGFGYGVFASHAQLDKTSYTDFGLKTALPIPILDVALMVGQRNMDTDNAPSNSNLFAGVMIKQDLIDGVAAYGTYQKGANFRDEVVGLTYDLNKSVQLNLSLKDYADNNSTTYKGLGGGLSLKF